MVKREYNELPEYQVVDLREENGNDKIFHCSVLDGRVVYFLAGPGSVYIDIELDIDKKLAYRVEVYGGKNSFTKNELDKKAGVVYNDIQCFLVAANSWVFSFAE